MNHHFRVLALVVLIAGVLSGCSGGERERKAQDQDQLRQLQQQLLQERQQRDQERRILDAKRIEAEGDASAAMFIAAAAGIALAVVILLLARERWLRRESSGQAAPERGP